MEDNFESLFLLAILRTICLQSRYDRKSNSRDMIFKREHELPQDIKFSINTCPKQLLLNWLRLPSFALNFVIVPFSATKGPQVNLRNKSFIKEIPLQSYRQLGYNFPILSWQSKKIVNRNKNTFIYSSIRYFLG